MALMVLTVMVMACALTSILGFTAMLVMEIVQSFRFASIARAAEAFEARSGADYVNSRRLELRMEMRRLGGVVNDVVAVPSRSATEVEALSMRDVDAALRSKSSRELSISRESGASTRTLFKRKVSAPIATTENPLFVSRNDRRRKAVVTSMAGGAALALATVSLQPSRDNGTAGGNAGAGGVSPPRTRPRTISREARRPISTGMPLAAAGSFAGYDGSREPSLSGERVGRQAGGIARETSSDGVGRQAGSIARETSSDRVGRQTGGIARETSSDRVGRQAGGSGSRETSPEQRFPIGVPAPPVTLGGGVFAVAGEAPSPAATRVVEASARSYVGDATARSGRDEVIAGAPLVVAGSGGAADSSMSQPGLAGAASLSAALVGAGAAAGSNVVHDGSGSGDEWSEEHIEVYNVYDGSAGSRSGSELEEDEEVLRGSADDGDDWISGSGSDIGADAPVIGVRADAAAPAAAAPVVPAEDMYSDEEEGASGDGGPRGAACSVGEGSASAASYEEDEGGSGGDGHESYEGDSQRSSDGAASREDAPAAGPPAVTAVAHAPPPHALAAGAALAELPETDGAASASGSASDVDLLRESVRTGGYVSLV